MNRSDERRVMVAAILLASIIQKDLALHGAIDNAIDLADRLLKRLDETAPTTNNERKA